MGVKVEITADAVGRYDGARGDIIEVTDDEFERWEAVGAVRAVGDDVELTKSGEVEAFAPLSAPAEAEAPVEEPVAEEAAEEPVEAPAEEPSAEPEAEAPKRSRSRKSSEDS